MNSASFKIEASRQLPLADAALRLLNFSLDENMLDDVFTRFHGRSFEREVSFSSCVHLMADSLVGFHGSAHLSFQAAIDRGDLDVSVQAMYRKIGRLPIELSLGLFDAASARLRTLGSFVANPLPASLHEFWCLGFDGKKVKYIVHKIKELRGLKGNIFGSKLLVVQDMATSQAVTLEAHADGEAGDNPLVPGAVARVRALGDSRPRLWVGDRGFCDSNSMELLSAENDHFVIRYNAASSFSVDDKVPARTGVDDEKRPYREEWGWLFRKGAVRVRKITVTRKTGAPFVIITNLLDADRYPAADLLILYRKRWGLETMFQQVVQTFKLRHLIGSTPQATVFQAVLCLLLYNVTLTLRDIMAKQAKLDDAERVSLFLLFEELVAQLVSWLRMIGPEQTEEVLGSVPINNVTELRDYLSKILADVWTDRWKKKPKRKQSPKRPPRAYLCGGHSSVYKIMRGEHHEIPLKPGQPGKPHEAKKTKV